MLRGELTECEEPERREVGKRLVEMPDELFEVDGSLERTTAPARGGRVPSMLGDEPGVARARCRPRPRANPTEKVLTGSRMFRAISATIRLESRPPLSIAPSGTSLIRRSANGLVELLEEQLGPLVRRSPTRRDGRRGIAPEALDANLAALDDQPVTRQELRNAREGGARRREEAEGQITRRSPRSRARRRRARSRAGSSALRRTPGGRRTTA